MKRPNIINRNWLACILSDVVFVPFAEKRTKTLALAKRIFSAQIPIFTTDHESNRDLHRLGIPGLTRKSVGAYLESLGGHKAQPADGGTDQIKTQELISTPELKSPNFLQGKLNF
ncbi:MAG TPA: hypothetical protein VLK23_05175 [Thermodesulfobacteriota bacterium]|nr:hypothetical protein [Thermodesulfobacteriota bacterium]